MKTLRPVLVIAALLAAGTPAQAGEPEPMGDAALDAITAGSAGKSPEELAAFEMAKTTASGNRIQALGTLEIIRSAEQNLLSLSDNAQQNLSALVNINAVNAPVNVLLNLNVNINSSVGSMQQLNIQGAPGNLTVTPAGK